MLDLRLMEIHLCDALRTRSDLTYDFVRKVLDRAGVGPEESRLDSEGKLVFKEQLKAKLRSHYWELYDETLGVLASECRAANIPVIVVIIPRVGKADAPAERRADAANRAR